MTPIPPNPSLGQLNFLNNKLDELLIKCAKKHIPTKIRKEESFNSLKPKDLVLSERYLSFCNRINRLLSKKQKHHIIDNPTHELWNKWLRDVNNIYAFLEITPSHWPKTVRTHNLSICRNSLTKLTSILIDK